MHIKQTIDKPTLYKKGLYYYSQHSNVNKCFYPKYIKYALEINKSFYENGI